MTRCTKNLPRTHSRLRCLALALAPVLWVSGCALLGGKKAVKTPVLQSPAKPGAMAPKAVSKGNPQVRFDQALALMKKHQTSQAITAFKSLTRDFPKYSGPFTNLGILYLHKKQWNQALQAYGQATAANPKNAAAYVGMGIAYRNTGDYTRAEKAYQKALSIRADDADAHFDLAVLYDVYLHRPAEALKQYQAYRANGHDDLIVAAWIKALEQQTGASASGTTKPSAHAAAATKPTAVEKH